MAEPTEVQNVPSAQLLLGLTALMAAAAPFHLMDLHLYANPVALGPNTAIGDFVEATFVGYAKIVAETFTTPYLDVDNTALALGADQAFICTAGTTPNTIYGYYFTDSTDLLYRCAYQFATPVGISAAGQAVTVVPFLRYSGN